MKLSYAYFPGCSAHGTGVEQDLSMRAVCAALDIELVELQDWNCCGATSAHAISKDLVVSLGKRNLDIAARTGLDLAVPCAACYSNLRAASLASGGPAAAVEVVAATRVLSRPEVLQRIVQRCKQGRLRGLKVVPYYGCLLVRPPEVAAADDPENPCAIDRIAEACGAEVLRWSYKTQCCGGSHALSHPKLVEQLSGRICEMARRVGAEAIVTACPMCHANLETQQWHLGRREADAIGLPVLYLTEMVGLALGLSQARGWLGRHLVDARAVLR